jgi:acyl-CoA hydrolase
MPVSEITLRFLAEPSDINFGGKVHGGSVMSWIDRAAYTCAANWSAHYCVTAYVSGIRFLKPINVGELVELKAELMHTGNTSMHISVSVRARNPRMQQDSFTTHCIVVFVATDEAGNPTPVPAFHPRTARQRHLNRYARRMIELRQDLTEESEIMLRELEQKRLQE